jgi:hypothetical protein
MPIASPLDSTYRYLHSKFCVNVDALDLDLDENQENLPSVVDRYAMVRVATAASQF